MLRWALVVAAVLSAGACGSSATTTSTAPTAQAGLTFYGPPSWAVNAQALGSSGDGTYNLIFANGEGVKYLVHTARQPLFPIPESPDRSGHGQLADGTPVTIACGGTTMAASGDGSTSPSEVAGPLLISWPKGDQVVSVLAPEDTGGCSPTPQAASSLIGVVGSLSQLDVNQWNQLVSEHPIPLSGDSAGSTSATAATGG
jgi:hypothetical protein